MPLIAVLSDPSIIESNAFLANLRQILGLHSAEKMVLLLGAAVFFLLVFSISLKAINSYTQMNFALTAEMVISKKLFIEYLGLSYSKRLYRHSSDLSKSMLSEVGHITQQAVIPLLSLISQTIAVSFLLVLLFVVNPLATIVVTVTLASVFWFLRVFGRGHWWLGHDRVTANEQRFLIAGEALAPNKSLALSGLEKVYLDRFTHPAKVYARAQAFAHVFGQVPRFVLEGLVFGGGVIVILVIYFSAADNFASFLPLAGIFTFAGYKILPALQQIYRSSIQLKFSGSTVEKVYVDLTENVGKHTVATSGFLCLNKCIELNNVAFAYPNAAASTINNLNLIVHVNTAVGLIEQPDQEDDRVGSYCWVNRSV